LPGSISSLSDYSGLFLSKVDLRTKANILLPITEDSSSSGQAVSPAFRFYNTSLKQADLYYLTSFIGLLFVSNAYNHTGQTREEG
jgi:hypothetical protein